MAPRAQTVLKPKRKLDATPVPALGLVSPPPLVVDTPAFQGSLAALFECVRDRRVELLMVPLGPICRAYVEYLLAQDEPRLDEAASALMALSYLVERKSWMLLPTAEPEPEEEEALELPEPTAHEYALAIQELDKRRLERESLFFRPMEGGPNPYEVPTELDSVTIGDLANALGRLLSKAVPTPIQPLNRPRRSLADVIGRVLLTLGAKPKPLEDLIDWPFTREDAVYWFLALLELTRLGRCRIQIHGDNVGFAAVL